MRTNLLHSVNSLTEPSLLELGTGAGAFPNSCVMSTLFLKRAPLISSFVSPLGFLKFFFRLDTICVLPVKIILQNHYVLKLFICCKMRQNNTKCRN